MNFPLTLTKLHKADWEETLWMSLMQLAHSSGRKDAQIRFSLTHVFYTSIVGLNIIGVVLTYMYALYFLFLNNEITSVSTNPVPQHF